MSSGNSKRLSLGVGSSSCWRNVVQDVTRCSFSAFSATRTLATRRSWRKCSRTRAACSLGPSGARPRSPGPMLWVTWPLGTRPARVFSGWTGARCFFPASVKLNRAKLLACFRSWLLGYSSACSSLQNQCWVGATWNKHLGVIDFLTNWNGAHASSLRSSERSNEFRHDCSFNGNVIPAFAPQRSKISHCGPPGIPLVLWIYLVALFHCWVCSIFVSRLEMCPRRRIRCSPRAVGRGPCRSGTWTRTERSMATVRSTLEQITSPQPFQGKCISEVVRFGSTIVFHSSKLLKAKFSILCDVIFLARLQGKFEIDHSWELNG